MRNVSLLLTAGLVLSTSLFMSETVDARASQEGPVSPRSHPRLKMRIAVAPIDWSERGSIGQWQMPTEFQNSIYEKLVKKLNDTGSFVVLEREALQNILTEKSIKEESSGQSQKGKLTPAQAMIKGRVTEFTVARRATGATLTISGFRVGADLADARVGLDLRIFGVDTSELIAAESAKGTSATTNVSFATNIGSSMTTFAQFEQSPLGRATESALDRCVKLIVRRLGEQPWSALVAEFDASKNEVTLTAGREMGIRIGDEFVVRRVIKIVKDPESGETLGRKSERIGLIRVQSVDPRFSTADVVEGGPFQPGDLVFERARRDE